MIDVFQNLNSLGYNTGIEIKTNPQNFDCLNDFIKNHFRLINNTLNIITAILYANSFLTKENILLVFLYKFMHRT